MSKYHTYWPGYLFALLFLTCTHLVTAASGNKHHILVLNSYNHGYAWTDNEVKGIQQVFAGREDIVLRIEYMDTKVINDQDHYDMLAEIYKRKYKDLNFDVIITTDDDALKFMRRYREDIFSNAPIVFAGVNNYSAAKTQGLDNFTGVNETADFSENFGLIKTLMPHVTELVIINDDLTTGKSLSKEFKAAVEASQHELKFTYLEHLSMSELKTRLSYLQPHQVVFYLSFFRDANGIPYAPSEAIPQLSRASTVPIFGAVDYMIGKGILGGFLKSAEYQGLHAGMKAKQILDGAIASNLPIAMDSPHQHIFDYQQLQRFNISQHELPKGSSLVNEPQTFYYKHKTIIWTVAVILSILLAYIGALLLNIQHRIRIQKGLQSILETSHTLFDVQAHQQFRHQLMQNLEKVLPNAKDILLMRYKGESKTFNETDLAIVDCATSNAFKHPPRTLDDNKDASDAVFKDSVKQLIVDAVSKSRCTYSKNEAVAKLESQKSPVNLLYVNGNRRLDKTDQQLFELFAGNVAMSIDNAETYKLSASLQTAHRIQSAMLPTDFAFASQDYCLDLHAFIMPAKEVGGDLYDFFALDEDNICMLVGDVSDKGVPAAIFMAMAKTVLRATADINLEPAEILYRANNELSRNNSETMFVTLFLTIFNRKTGVLKYADGGHNAPFTVSANGEVHELKSQGGTALGIMEDLPYFTGEIRLNEGDGVLLYTDGVTEAANENNELYGEERLAQCLEKYHQKDSQQLDAMLLEDICTFVDQAPQSDDITSLFFRYHKQAQ